LLRWLAAVLAAEAAMSFPALLRLLQWLAAVLAAVLNRVGR